MTVRRREFIGALGGAAAWPVVARAQRPPAVPVVGFLSGISFGAAANQVEGFQQGLRTASPPR
jgi:putative tryptophan/tyrosine transport system substrate-binding protein